MAVWVSAFLLAFVLGSLAEYWGHRAMHVWLERARHVQHHLSESNQALLREFWGYSRGTYRPIDYERQPRAWRNLVCVKWR